ncbi:unnamed protein product, partial [Symbiodinium pilosum]
VHKITGPKLEEFNKNVGSGMEIRFNLWPGDETFGGHFKVKSLPVYQYIDWVRYSSYSGRGRFKRRWQQDFNSKRRPRHWFVGSWNSPLGYSKHRPKNVIFTHGYAVLALTHADDVPSATSIPIPPRGPTGSPKRPGKSMEPPDAPSTAVVPTPNTVASAELLTWVSRKYGKFEARMRHAGGDGVVSSFYLWKKGSEKSDVFWNELDFEKRGTMCDGICKLQANFIDGMPGPEDHEKTVDPAKFNICGGFHTYAFEWTPSEARYTIDGVEVQKITGPRLEEFNRNVGEGLEFRFNLWPNDQSSGGHLPVYQYIDWVRYSSFAGPGHFREEMWEGFDGNSAPHSWFTGSWTSSSGYSRHRPENVLFTN